MKRSLVFELLSWAILVLINVLVLGLLVPPMISAPDYGMVIGGVALLISCSFVLFMCWMRVCEIIKGVNTK